MVNTPKGVSHFCWLDQIITTDQFGIRSPTLMIWPATGHIIRIRFALWCKYVIRFCAHSCQFLSFLDRNYSLIRDTMCTNSGIVCYRHDETPYQSPCADQKIVGNLLQPIGGLITGNCIHQGFRQKVTGDVIGQIGNIQFPRILWYVKFSGNFWYILDFMAFLLASTLEFYHNCQMYKIAHLRSKSFQVQLNIWWRPFWHRYFL